MAVEPNPRGVARSATAQAPIAVVDIGSNSVRLVVFDGPLRAPTLKFNEKVLCGLGRRMAQTGRLDEEGVALAITSLRRFTSLVRRMGVPNLQVVATAAVREAKNGDAFVAEVERQCQVPVRVLAGAEEAHYSALGVLSGIPDADGLMGDLGGGSLELVALDQGRVGEALTLPLGPFRLMSLPESSLRGRIDRTFAGVPWLDRVRGRRLYLVGGAWRAIARIHMAQHDYPLRIIHHYRLSLSEADEITRLLSRQSKESLMRLQGVPRRRVETLPTAALTLRRLLKRVAPREIVFSAHGLREGMCFDALPEALQAEDPLLAACRDMAASEGRFGEHGAELVAFTRPLFEGEDAEQARLRHAACLLGDTAWRVNPDYRGEQAFRRILRAPIAGIDHPGRAFISLAVYARYAGGFDDQATLPGQFLASDEQAQQALRLGLALRLANTLSAGIAGVLKDMKLVLEEKTLTLEVAPDAVDLMGEAVMRHLESLAKNFRRSADIRVAG